MSSSSKKKKSLSLSKLFEEAGERVCFFFDFFLSFFIISFKNVQHTPYHQTPKKRRRRKEKENLILFTNFLKEATTLRGGAEKNDAVLRAQTHRIPLFVVVVVVVVFFRGSTARQKAVSSHFPSTQCHSSRDRASPQGFPVRNEKK